MRALPPGAFDGVKVIELSGPLGGYCGKLFADLGADVILVEPPEGDDARHRPPLTAEGESLWFAYHNANKRGVVHDPAKDTAAIESLLSTAHILIGNGSASWPAAWGLSLEELRQRHPSLVIVSLTPFGLTGPYSSYEATDLVCLAMGGLLALGGYGDGSPLQVAGDQAFNAVALFGAVGAALALLHAESAGVGQIVDASAQEAIAMALEHAIQYYDLVGTVRGRQTGRQRGAGAGLYRCADGWLYLFVGGIASGRFWTRFVEWMLEERVTGADELTGSAWDDRAYFETDEAKSTFLRVFEAFSGTRGMEELYREAQARGIAAAPVRAPSGVVASAQLAMREYFQPITTPMGREVLAPGAPYTFSETPWVQRCPVPRLGEHTGLIDREVGGHD